MTWVLLVAGPAFGWAVGSVRAAPLYLESWQERLLWRVALGAGLPLLLAVLNLLVRGRLRAAAPLLVAALCAAATTLPALLDLAAGPRWESVTIRESTVFSAPRGGARFPTYRMHLDDGRELAYGVGAASGLLQGPARVAVLRHSGAALAVEGARHVTPGGRNAVLLGLAALLLLACGALLLGAARADRRAAWVRDTLVAGGGGGGGGAWVPGRSGALQVFLATERSVDDRSQHAYLRVLPWTAFSPGEPPLETESGTRRLRGPALFLPPLDPALHRTGEAELSAALQAQGFARVEGGAPVAPPPGAGIALWQRVLPDRGDLLVYGRGEGDRLVPARPGLPLLVTAAQAEAPTRAVAFGAALLSEGSALLIGAVVALVAAGLCGAAWFTR